MQRITNIKMTPESTFNDLKKAVAETINATPSEIKTFNIVKKSIDARNKNDVKIIYSVDVSRQIETKEPLEFLEAKNKPNNPPIIIGSGPAGLFAGLILAHAGLKPIIFERGADVDKRKADVDNFIINGVLNESSNIQFGEGGAGTFSDGKLNTLVKSKYNDTILRILVECGAPSEILYLSKPHIGTDNLINVVKNIRARILSLGGEIHFNSLVEDIIIDNNTIKGVKVNNQIIDTDTVLLAIGHSARDTFEMLYNTGIAMEQKEFAVGFRIEHLREMINRCQYGKFATILPAADYKLVSHTITGRAVYTFCMCPGGWVIPAVSEKGHLVTNGMSLYNRNAINSNSALLCNVTRKDFKSEHPLAGISYQRELEKKAFLLGGGSYMAPVQRVGDFLAGKMGKSIGGIEPSYKPNVTLAPLHQLFNKEITDTFKYAIKDMARFIKGFDIPDAILTAVETRTSSPVRILRGENYMSINTDGLYPIGEGCGYAGGIMSAAIDGLRVANFVVLK